MAGVERVFLGFHLSRTRSILVAYTFLRRLSHRYGFKPIYNRVRIHISLDRPSITESASPEAHRFIG